MLPFFIETIQSTHAIASYFDACHRITAVGFVAKLLQVEPKALEEALLIRTNIVGKEVFKVPLTLTEVRSFSSYAPTPYVSDGCITLTGPLLLMSIGR
jgi:hypothetical protein